MPMDLCLVIDQISGSIEYSVEQLSQVKTTSEENVITISKFADSLFNSCGIVSSEWSFSDLLFIRFFGRVNKKFLNGNAFVLHVACFLSHLCMSSNEQLLRSVIDIYLATDSSHSLSAGCHHNASKKPSSELSWNDCECIVRDVLSKSSKHSEQQIIEKLQQLRDYHTATRGLHSGDMVRIEDFVCFCTKIHPNIMWPLFMMQKQIQSKFLGEKFWIHQSSSEFYKFLTESKGTRNVFWLVEVMSKVFPISNKKLVEFKDNSSHDTIGSLIRQKKISKLSPNSIYAEVSVTRSVTESCGWVEDLSTTLRWWPRPTLAYDIYTYALQFSPSRWVEVNIYYLIITSSLNCFAVVSAFRVIMPRL